MKFLAILAILSLTTAFSSAYATETNTAADDVTAYCLEQAEIAGIDDAVEKQEYMKECTESYATENNGEQPAAQ
jgi:hypothetical protein